MKDNKLASEENVELFSEESIPKLNILLHQIQVPEKLQLDPKLLVSLQNAHTQDVERFLYVSPVIKYNDFENGESVLVKSLCTVVEKMMLSHVDQRLLLNHTFMKFDQNSFKWVTLGKISFSDECKDKGSDTI